MVERELPELTSSRLSSHDVPLLDGALEVGAEGKRLESPRTDVRTVWVCRLIRAPQTVSCGLLGVF